MCTMCQFSVFQASPVLSARATMGPTKDASEDAKPEPEGGDGDRNNNSPALAAAAAAAAKQ